MPKCSRAYRFGIQGFFRRVKAGEKPGYPRFRGKHRCDSFTFPQSGFSLTHDNRVCLSKIGSIKLVYHREIRSKIKPLTIHKSSTGKWYASFLSGMVDAAQLNGALAYPDGKPGLGIDGGAIDHAAITQVEAGAMPGTLDDISFFERSFIERPALMRAGGPDGIDSAAPPQQDGGNACHVHPRQLAFGKGVCVHHRDILI